MEPSDSNTSSQCCRVLMEEILELPHLSPWGLSWRVIVPSVGQVPVCCCPFSTKPDRRQSELTKIVIAAPTHRIYIYRDYDDHDDHCHKGGTFGLLTSLSTQVFPLVCYIYRVLGETMIVVTEIMADKEWNS